MIFFQEKAGKHSMIFEVTGPSGCHFNQREVKSVSDVRGSLETIQDTILSDLGGTHTEESFKTRTPEYPSISVHIFDNPI